GLQGARRSNPAPSPRPALRARRPHAHGARVRARDDPLRRHEAPARPRGRRSRRPPPGGPGEAPLPEPRADPADPRPVDRQVHRAPRRGARRSQARTGGNCMTTMTAQTTQVYSVFIRATPEQIWDAITKAEFTQQYFFGASIEVRDGRRFSA